MAIINFYYITTDTLEKTTCQLLEKCYNTGAKTLVRVPTENAMESLNKTLWTFAQKSFIPHGSKNDEVMETQPIYITYSDENPIDADMIMLVDSLDGIYDNFDRIFVLFTESIADKVKHCIEKLSTSKNSVSCYKQDAKTGWQSI